MSNKKTASTTPNPTPGPTSSDTPRSDIYRLQPFYYIHVLDQNTNVTRVEFGPKTFICQDHERVVFGPEKMIVVPPRNYVTIENPVRYNAENGQLLTDQYGQVLLKHGEQEVRLTQDPFPLYPGEQLVGGITPLQLIRTNEALRLRALQNFIDENDAKRTAGDEWLFEGPNLYVPNPNVEKIGEYRATLVKRNQALRLVALQDTIDRDGNKRVAGEEWMVNKKGAYLPGIFEKIVSIVDAFVLTNRLAIHIRALRSFTDQFGKERKNGEEWLVTNKLTEAYIPSVHEEVVGRVDITTLNSRQYCVILDPYDSNSGQNQLGGKKLITGECSFFLQPGESLERGIEDVYILSEQEGLILSANEEFNDTILTNDGPTKKLRKPGDRWMIRGPMEYVPPVQAKVIRKNRAIPLHKNEGIYIRNIKTGRVYAEIGKTYLLNENEELWEKELPEFIETLLLIPTEFGRVPEELLKSLSKEKRDKTKVVSYRVPHNSVVQIYDYKEKTARVVFGPSLVMLGPDEMFTPLSLSGGIPKEPGVIKTLHLMLGPDFCTDLISVETSDHARLNLRLSYSWQFDIPHGKKIDPKWATTLFSVSDFIGDACKAIASHIRGAVAGVPFDDFHKNSARLIRASVFGLDENGKVKDKYLFPANNLIITGIDIKSIEPEDAKTREALQKSVQLAIEITTSAQESLARQEAERMEQEAKGKLDRQRIFDQAEAEEARKTLTLLQSECRAVQTTGQARAEAQSRAQASKIKGESAVNEAKLTAKGKKTKLDTDINQLEKTRESELKYLKTKQELEIEHKEKMAQIQAQKFKDMIEAIGTKTIENIANGGPQLQRELLLSLGIKSTLITDGKSPIHLFNSVPSNVIAQSSNLLSSLK